MIQYELFLKEISDFLRSCTIKNKYFAQITANKVMEKYGLSSLPDHFNPYYLRMCGLSTLDLVIPMYLYDEDGRRVLNEDYIYRKITDTDPDLTHLIMVRLDVEDDDGKPIYASSEKLNVGIETIASNINLVYLNSVGYTNSDGTPYEGKNELWMLKDEESKVLALKEKMAGFNPDDDGVVVNIITGDLSWKDLVTNCEVFSNGYTVKDVSKVEVVTDDEGNVTNYINGEQVTLETGDILNVTSEQSTYVRTAQDTWAKRTLDGMFDIALTYYASISDAVTESGNHITDRTAFIRSSDFPYVEALVVIGHKHLDWDGMYSAGYETFANIDAEEHNGVAHGALIDIEFNKINSALGYSETTYPQAGSRVNFIRTARAWSRKDTDGKTDIVVYTAKESPEENDFVYSDPYLINVLQENGVDIRVFSVEDDSDITKFLYTTESNNAEYSRTEDTIKKYDYAIKHCTYEFNGIDWIEVPLRKLFDEEWKIQFKNSCFGNYPKLTYTTMADPFDTESFNEKLIVDDNNRTLGLPTEKKLILDRYEYTGWDKPVYVPTYDKENNLTRDFTLYTRFSNRMREEHVKTALKYHIGAKVYNDACEKYPEYIDFIKGVCYPAHRQNRDLASSSTRLRYTYFTADNGVPMRVAYKEDYDKYITNIELTINEIASDPNFTLEKYDSTLLKENEADSIIDCLNRVLSCMRERWDVGEFGYEELYYAAMWATLWAHLPYLLLVQRMLNLRTEAVHVDHIWEYLEGKGLKDYRTVMDNDQMLFLYKNIDYLRGNEGKQKTLKILVEKLLERFSATVRTKSILLDTTYMKENLTSRAGNLLSLTNGTFNINGLSESVSGDVKILSEDLEEQTSVISDVDGRIEDYDDVYTREYKSGLVPKLGDTLAEQRQRITESHNEIEITKHTYAPTKLAEITQGSTTSDTARLAMAFIFQTLIRKLSGSEISDACVVNAIFNGLSSPKTFTVGECIALIFYALRKQDWYTYKNKYGEQVFHKNDLWKNLVDIDDTPISVGDRNALVSLLKTYEDCAKYGDPTAESDCDHSFYTINETFNDSIPSKADIWLPYRGNYVRFNTDELVEISVPSSVTGLDELIGNKTICINGRTLLHDGAYKQFMQILSPYEYSSLELTSWNEMCDAEFAGNVPEKYDASLGSLRQESHVFQKVTGTTSSGGTSDGTLVGGLVTGSSRSVQDKWYIAPIPDASETINTHDRLIESLSEQANTMLDHYQLTRSKSDAYFHFAMTALYKCITITDKIKLDLVPGYTTYSEWFESDVELKSVFRTIEEGSDQASIYGSIADSLISALFPSDKIVITGSVDQTKYAAMKELFQWLGSYNIAYLNTSSVQYETLFLHPITINATWPKGINDRSWLCDYDKGWYGIGMYTDGKSGRVIEHWSTSNFEPGFHVHYWPVIASGWSLTDATLFERDPDKQKSTCVSLNGFSAEYTASLLYGSSEDAMKIQVYKKSDLEINGNEICKTGITKSNFYYSHKLSWTSNSKPTDPSTPWDPWHVDADLKSGVVSYVGAATYVSTDDANTYRQTDVTLEPIYIQFNQQ